MKIINEEYKFSFEVPDDYEEIAHEDYGKYGLDRSTLNIFVKFDGRLPHTISLNRDVEAENEEDYVSLVLLNIQNMEKMDMKITNHINYKKDEKRIDVVYSNFKNLKYATYFTMIRKLVVACSIEIDEINDENDVIIAKLFESIEEI